MPFDNRQFRQIPVHLDSLPSNYCRFESAAIIGLQLIVLRFRRHHEYHRHNYYHHHSRQCSRDLAFTLLSTGHMRL